MVEGDWVAGSSVGDLVPRTGMRLRISPGSLSLANLRLSVKCLGGHPTQVKVKHWHLSDNFL